MELETTRFGTLTIEPEAVITLTQPILGFQQNRRYILLPGPSEPLTWLQSSEKPDLAFILLDPRAVVSDYRVECRDSDLAELGAESVSELDVFSLVVVPEDPAQIRTNLRAPIVINRKQRLGKQIILDRSNYPIQYYLAQPGGGSDASQEVSHARSNA